MAGAAEVDHRNQTTGHDTQPEDRPGSIRGERVLQHTAGGLARSQHHSQGQPLIPAGRAGWHCWLPEGLRGWESNLLVLDVAHN